MDRNEFLDLGTHCSAKHCNQLDFLPFKCPSCALPYCQEHWRPTAHPCPSYDPIAADNRVPSCPLCNTPISFPLNTDPDLAMDAHLETSCAILHPGRKARPVPGAMPVCDERKCKTKMVLPIRCESCRGSFCAPHRWGKDHGCVGDVRLLESFGKGKAVERKGKSLGMAGLAALRRAQKKVGTGKGTKEDPIVLGDSSDDEVQIVEKAPGKEKEGAEKKMMSALAIPGKADKRAMAERASAKKSLEARAKKGLLTEDEKVRYATERAIEVRRGGGSKDKGCLMS